jgi:hypothetical protein
MDPEEVLELMRSAPERYGSVRAAVARRARPRHETAKKQSNAEEETQR